MRIGLLVIAAGCASSAPPAPAKPPIAPPPGMALLTIDVALPAGCEPGVFLIDGMERGRYPVSQAVVPAGCHVLKIESAGDCAGYGETAIDFIAGREARLGKDELRALAFGHGSCP